MLHKHGGVCIWIDQLQLYLRGYEGGGGVIWGIRKETDYRFQVRAQVSRGLRQKFVLSPDRRPLRDVKVSMERLA